MRDQIGIVVDSTLIQSMESAKEANIAVQPLYITKETETLKDYYDITPQEVYSKQRAGASFKTSQPSAGEFAETYERLISEGKTHIVVFTISKLLSGTHQSAVAATQLVEGAKIVVIDTKITTAQVWNKIISITEDLTVDNFDSKCKEFETSFDNFGIYAYVGSVEYLKRGGRLSASNALIANLLNIRPILELPSAGEVKAIDKKRSLAKALEGVINLVKAKNPKRLFVLDTDDENRQLVDKFIEQLSTEFPSVPIERHTLCSVLGAHVGPEACVVSYEF